jgi:hypothetical protein
MFSAPKRKTSPVGTCGMLAGMERDLALVEYPHFWMCVENLLVGKLHFVVGNNPVENMITKGLDIFIEVGNFTSISSKGDFSESLR